MRSVLAIMVKDMRLRSRDRSTYIFAFVAPLVLATIISFAFRSGNAGFQSTFAIADLDRSQISRSFLEGIEQGLSDAVTIKTANTEPEARRLTVEGDANAAIVIPAGFTAAVQNGESVELKVFRHVDSPISGAIATSIAEAFANELNAGRLAVATAVAASQDRAAAKPIDLPELIRKSAEERIPISLETGKLGAREITSASYFGPAMAIFFLSFTVQFGVIGFLTERREGTLKRVLASPVRPAHFILGKSMGAFVVGMISLVVMNVATTYLLDASWGPWIGVLLLGAATIFAFMGVAAIGATVAKTQEGAAGFVGIVMTVFALLGGNFIQLSQAPATLRTLSLGTPNGWAIRGFVDLTTGGGMESIVQPIIALVTIAVAGSAVALTRGKRLVSA